MKIAAERAGAALTTADFHFANLLRSKVEGLLEGLAEEPAPQGPEWLDENPPSRLAAVAMVLCPNDVGEASFVLTRRASSLRNHGGQWALPGGRIDSGETVKEAALRELSEEVGLHIEPTDILGCLDDFHTRSGYRITPVVCWYSEKPDLLPNPGEVASAHLVPFTEFDGPDVPLLRSIPESARPVLSLPVNGQRIHAPTAAMVYQLYELAIHSRLVPVAHFEQPVFAWQ